MKTGYRISRIAVGVLTLLVMMLLFINEDSSWIKLACMYAAAAYLVSIPATFLVKKIIAFGDKIESLPHRILYYSVITGGSALLDLALFIVVLVPLVENSGGTFGEALNRLFLAIGIVVAIMVPAVQTILVLIIRRLLHASENSQDTAS